MENTRNKLKRRLKGGVSSKSKLSPFSITILVFLILYTVIILGLFAWAFLRACQDSTDFQSFYHTYGFPEKWVNNFKFVFDMEVTALNKNAANFWTCLGNSLLYALGCAFFRTLVPCITAYACARFNFKSSKVVYTIVLLMMIVPVVGNLSAELKLAKALGLYNHIWGMWIMSASMQGLYFFVMYGTFKAMPMGYTEAAKIDGANNFQIMVKIIFPLIINLFLTIILINFVEYWNNYQTPMLYLRSYPTLGYSLYYYGPGHLGRAPMELLEPTGLIALALMVMLPIFILFLIFQDKLMGNLTMGGLKG